MVCGAELSTGAESSFLVLPTMNSTLQVVVRVLLALVAAAAGALVVALTLGNSEWYAPLLTTGCLSLAVATLCSAALRPLAFTIWIAAGVVLGMCHPTWFIGVGDFKYTALFVPILQVIMFGMGTTLSVGDFVRVSRMPGGVLVGIVCQFTIMPLVGYLLARTCGFPAEIAAGFVLVGVSPSGLASNVMSYVARANVALSVTMTAVITLLAPVVTPLLMRLLAGQLIEIDVLAMMWSMTKIVLLPVVAGLVFHHLFYQRHRWLDRVMPLVSMGAIFVMTVLTVAPGRDNLLRMGMLLIVACLAHCTAGFVLGYLGCRVLGMDPRTCRTISIEVGMQNAGMASGIAATLGKVTTLGLAPIVFGPVMNITASILANWWRSHPVTEPAGMVDKGAAAAENAHA